MNFTFLPYQQKVLSDEINQLIVVEKSRRIGMSWAVAGDCAIYASRTDGGDVYYKGQDKEMAQTFINDAAWFAKEICNEVCPIFEDPEMPDKSIFTFKIHFKNGHKIVAQSSNPAGLRSKGRPSDRFVFDEAAFHPDFKALLKAAMALMMWGCRIMILSSHNGEDNPFNELIKDIRSGKRPGKVYRVTFQEAVADGLFKRVCQMTGQAWSEEAEQAWVAQMYAYYGSDAQEELDVIPSSGSGVVLTRAQIERCMKPAIVQNFSG